MKYPQFYGKPNLNRSRDSMPQIDEEDADLVAMHFANTVGGKRSGVRKVKKRIGDLKPAQNEINEEKVDKMLIDGYDWRGRTYFISKDDYLGDGHHAYALGLSQDPDAMVDCYQIMLKGKEMIRRMNLLKITRKEDLESNQLEKALRNILLSKAFLSKL